MNLKAIASLMKNSELVGSVLRQAADEGEINSSLDRMLNSVDIFYFSKEDFMKNFPAEDDIEGKAKLIISRRK